MVEPPLHGPVTPPSLLDMLLACEAELAPRDWHVFAVDIHPLAARMALPSYQGTRFARTEEEAIFLQCSSVVYNPLLDGPYDGKMRRYHAVPRRA
jgi:hypothetical protein